MAISLVGIGLVSVYSRNKIPANQNSAASDSVGNIAGVSTENSTSVNPDSTYIQQLAQFLSDNGMILYGTYWDQDTINQKKLFNDSADKIDYVECDRAGADANPDECLAQSVQTYPTWIYKGKQYQGIQSLAALAKIVNFSTDQSSE